MATISLNKTEQCLLYILITLAKKYSSKISGIFSYDEQAKNDYEALKSRVHALSNSIFAEAFQKWSYQVMNFIVTRQFDFDALDTLLKDTCWARGSLSAYFWSVPQYRDNTFKLPDNPTVLARALAKFCCLAGIIWDIRSLSTIAFEQMLRTNSGSIFNEYKCFSSAAPVSTPTSAGSVTKGATKNVGQKKALGPLSGFIAPAVLKDEIIKTATDVIYAITNTASKDSYLKVSPVKISNSEGSLVAKAATYSGSALPVEMSSAHSYDKTICYFEDLKQAEDALSTLGLTSSDIKIVAFSKNAIDGVKFRRLATVVGTVLVKSAFLNETYFAELAEESIVEDISTDSSTTDLSKNYPYYNKAQDDAIIDQAFLIANKN